MTTATLLAGAPQLHQRDKPPVGAAAGGSGLTMTVAAPGDGLSRLHRQQTHPLGPLSVPLLLPFTGIPEPIAPPAIRVAIFADRAGLVAEAVAEGVRHAMAAMVESVRHRGHAQSLGGRVVS